MDWGIFLFILIAAVANVAGGFVIFFKKNWSRKNLNALIALSAGLLLSVAIMDLIPEALHIQPESAGFIILGMLTIFFFQQFVASHFHFGEETHAHKITKGTALGAFIGLLIHTFFDGFAVVISFEVEFRLGIVVLLAVLLHKIPDGVTIASIIFTLFRNRKKAILSAALLGASTIFGAIVALILHGFPLPFEQISAAALAFSAGVFLYLAGTDLLPVVNASEERSTAAFFIVGVLLYFVFFWVLEPFTPHFH